RAIASHRIGWNRLLVRSGGGRLAAGPRILRRGSHPLAGAGAVGSGQRDAGRRGAGCGHFVVGLRICPWVPGILARSACQQFGDTAYDWYAIAGGDTRAVGNSCLVVAASGGRGVFGSNWYSVARVAAGAPSDGGDHAGNRIYSAQTLRRRAP